MAWLALAGLVVAAFAPALRNGFVDYDDPVYITANREVLQGLTVEGILWALFSTEAAGNWHPLTWMSHMLDVSLFGLAPGCHHAVSLGLHLLNALLLPLVLISLTGRPWPSLGAAALFAVHPLRVESVVWAAERKDVLAASLALLALATWIGHLRRPAVWRYALALGLFMLGLMAKPMVVTLPLVLFLLDVWPLGRWTAPNRNRQRLVLEKTPWLALSAASCWITLTAQSVQGNMGPTSGTSAIANLAAVPVSYVRYLFLTIWPHYLAPFYPFPPGGYPWWNVVAATVLLVFLSVVAIRQFRHRPFLAVGWAWFLGMTVPVIGVVHVGYQSIADRYTYLPHIGLLMALAWGAASLPAPMRQWRIMLPVVLMSIAVILAYQSNRQTIFWKDSLTLFTRAAESVEDNWLAHMNLGVSLDKEGRTAEGVVHLVEALRLYPADAMVHFNLGVALMHLGRMPEAIAEYRAAVGLRPDFPEAHYNLGTTLLREGRFGEAVVSLSEAVGLSPGNADALANLGICRLYLDDPQGAELLLTKSLKIKSDPRIQVYLDQARILLRPHRKKEE
jgi:Flp pilus assembly protein TadD